MIKPYNKKLNIVLVLTLIGVVLCQDSAFALRPPLDKIDLKRRLHINYFVRELSEHQEKSGEKEKALMLSDVIPLIDIDSSRERGSIYTSFDDKGTIGIYCYKYCKGKGLYIVIYPDGSWEEVTKDVFFRDKNQSYSLRFPYWFNNPKATPFERLGNPEDTKALMKNMERLKEMWANESSPIAQRLWNEILDALAIFIDVAKTEFNGPPGEEEREKDQAMAGLGMLMEEIDAVYELPRTNPRDIRKAMKLHHSAEREVEGISWRKDGTLIISKLRVDHLDGVLVDPGSEITRIDLLNGSNQQGIPFMNRVCSQIADNPVNDNIAVLVTDSASHAFMNDNGNYPTIVMVFKWEELLENTKLGVPVDSAEYMFTEEGVMSLPGCKSCLVLPDLENTPESHVMKWSSDGKKLVIIDNRKGEIIEWDVAKGRYTTFQIPKELSVGGEAITLDIDPEKGMIGSQIQKVKLEETLIEVDLNYDSSFAACLYENEYFPKGHAGRFFTKIFDMKSKEFLVQTGVSIRNINLLPNGNLVFSSGYNAKFEDGIYLWDWNSGEGEEKILDVTEDESVHDLIISPDGKFLIKTYILLTDYRNHKMKTYIQVFDLERQEETTITPLATYIVKSKITKAPDSEDPVIDGLHFEWSPDSLKLIASTTGKFTIWEIGKLDDRALSTSIKASLVQAANKRDSL